MLAPRRDRTESPRNVAAQPGPMQYRVLVDRADQSSWQEKRPRSLQCVLPRESPLLPAYQGSRDHPTIRDERGSLVRNGLNSQSSLIHNHPTSLGKRERQGDYLPPRQDPPWTPAGEIPCTLRKTTSRKERQYASCVES